MAPPRCGIYAIVNLANGHLYLGSSVNIRRRVNAHKSDLRNSIHRNPRLQRAWDRYGETGFAFLTLFECDESVVRLLEGLVLEACRPAYNLTMSVDGSTRLSAETKRRLSVTRRGVPKSAAHRRHIGEAHKGKRKSAAWRANLSASAFGRKNSPETCRKIADGLRRAYREGRR